MKRQALAATLICVVALGVVFAGAAANNDWLGVGAVCVATLAAIMAAVFFLWES